MEIEETDEPFVRVKEPDIDIDPYDEEVRSDLRSFDGDAEGEGPISQAIREALKKQRQGGYHSGAYGVHRAE